MAFVIRVVGYMELPDTFRGELPDLVDRLATASDAIDPTASFRQTMDDPWRHHADLLGLPGTRHRFDTFLQRDDSFLGAAPGGGPAPKGSA